MYKDYNTTISEKTVQDINDLIANGEVKTIFLLENEKYSPELEQILENGNIKSSLFRRIDTIKDDERKNNYTYLTIMNSNIELLKKELYD